MAALSLGHWESMDRFLRCSSPGVLLVNRQVVSACVPARTAANRPCESGVTPGVRLMIHGSKRKNMIPTLQASRLDYDTFTPSGRSERNTNSSRYATNAESQSAHRATPAVHPAAPVTVRSDAEGSKPLQLLEEALAAHHGSLDARTVAALMKQNMGRWRGVLALYDWMAHAGVPRTLYIYTIVLESLGRAKQWQLLNRVVADLHRQGISMDEYVYNTLIVCYSKAGKFMEALSWFRKMDEAGCAPNQVILTSVLKLSVRARRFKEAATIADMLREGGTSYLDCKTVCTLISAYGATGNIRAAEEVFAGSKLLAVAEADVTMWNAMIAAFSRNNHMRKAEALLAELEVIGRRGGGAGNDDAGGSLAVATSAVSPSSGLPLSGDASTAGAETVEQVEAGPGSHACGDTGSPTLSTITSDAPSESHALSSHKGGGGRKVHRRDSDGWEKDESAPPSAVNARHLPYGNGVGKVQNFSSARDGDEDGQSGGGEEGRGAGESSGAVAASGNRREVVRGRRWVKGMARMGPTLNSYNSLLMGYSRLGDARAAERTFERLVAAGFTPSTVTFNTLLSLYASLPPSSTSLSGVAQLIARMRSHGLALDQYAYCSLISLFGRAGLVDEAEGLFQEMKGEGIQPDSHLYSALITVRARSNRLDEALAAYREMVEEGCHVDAVVMTSLVGVYHRKGMLEEASAAAMKALEMGNGHLDAVTASAVISFFTKEGRLGDAVKVFRAAYRRSEHLPLLSVSPGTNNSNNSDSDDGTNVISSSSNGSSRGIATVQSGNQSRFDTSGTGPDAGTRTGRGNEEHRPDFASSYADHTITKGSDDETNLVNRQQATAAHDSGVASDLGLPMEQLIRAEGGQDIGTGEDGSKEMLGVGKVMQKGGVGVGLSGQRQGQGQQLEGVDMRDGQTGISTGKGEQGEHQQEITSEQQLEVQQQGQQRQQDKQGQQQQGQQQQKGQQQQQQGRRERHSQKHERRQHGVDGGQGKGWQGKGRASSGNSKGPEILLSAMTDAFAKAGQVEEAEAMFRELQAHERRHPVNVVAYTTMINLYGKHDMVEQAEELFHALQSKASGSIDAFVCNAMLAAYVRSADVAAAESLLEDMLQRGPRPTVYSFSIMIDAYGKAGRPDDALRAFSQLLQCGLAPSIVTFNSLLLALAKAGRALEVSDAMRRMRERGLQPLRSTFRILLGMHVEAGDGTRAMRLVRDMEEAGYATDSFTSHQLSLLRLKSIRSQHPNSFMVPAGAYMSHPTSRGGAPDAGPAVGRMRRAAPAVPTSPSPLPPSLSTSPPGRGNESEGRPQVLSEEYSLCGDVGAGGLMAQMTVNGREMERGVNDGDDQASQVNGRGDDFPSDIVLPGNTGHAAVSAGESVGGGDKSTGAHKPLEGVTKRNEGDGEGKEGGRSSGMVDDTWGMEEGGEGEKRGAAHGTEPMLLHKPRNPCLW